MLILLLLSFLVLYVSWYLLVNRKYLLLPNPGLCLPVLGHIHHLLSRKARDDPVNTLCQVYEKHNNGKGLIWFRKFTLNFIYVGDFNTVKELFNHPDIQERGVAGAFDLAKEEQDLIGNSYEEHPGITISCGKIWSEQRRFTLRTLRDFGFGKKGMEELIKEEVSSFISYLRKTEGEEVSLMEKFKLPIINSLWQITSGVRFEYDDPELMNIMEGLTTSFLEIATPKNRMVIAFPWMAKIDWLRNYLGRPKFVQMHMNVVNLMRKTVSEHKNTIDTNEPRDFIDMMLMEISKTDNPDSSFFKEKGEENLVMTLFDLFFAGAETTSTTFNWGILYMLRNPEVQDKLHAELDQVVGKERAPTMEDRGNMPYTQAVIMEIQRMANIGPEGVIHRCKRDVKINGLTIPANSLVNALYTEVLQGNQWKDGTSFKPERFLNEEGKVIRAEQLIPFGVGKRHCPGEALAKAELFLFIAGLLQQFTFSPPVAGQIPTEKYQSGLTRVPEPYTLKITSRI